IIQHGEFTTNDLVRFNISPAFGDRVVWGLIDPSLDVLIYSEPASKVFTQGVLATVSNIVAVGIIGTLDLTSYASVSYTH
ncbi:ECF transporter S component, partial [Enterococcus faecalis]|uniref:ECF transporter S component n=1 Tax=Enterococcus faecalis TaxID=1351 RepID=UPI0021DFEC9C